LIVIIFGKARISAAEHGTGMGGGVDFEAHSLVEPLLEPGKIGVDPVGGDGECGPTVDIFEAVEDRAKECFVAGGIPEIVDGEDDYGLDIILSDPLRGRQLRKEP